MATTVDVTGLRRRLDLIFEARDRAFPRRDPANTAAMQAALDEYTGALRALRSPGWRPDPRRCDEALAMAEQALFVCGYMKSGTSFVVSLLDHHPQLTVVPGDSHLVALFVDRHRGTPYQQRLAGQDRHWVARLANYAGQAPFWFLGDDDRDWVAFLEYLDHWLHALPPVDRSLFLAAVLALHCANPRRAVRPTGWVEKTPGNELRVADLAALFPRARFLHVVREPFTNLASMKQVAIHRGWGWHGPWRIVTEALRLRRSMRTSLANRRRLGPERYHVVRYEDLARDPRSRMVEVAAFAGIGWDDTLVVPTVNGVPQTPNSMYADRRQRGSVIASSERWRRELTPTEQRLALGVLGRTRGRLGYGSRPSAGSGMGF
jgi:hypothetical protein